MVSLCRVGYFGPCAVFAHVGKHGDTEFASAFSALVLPCALFDLSSDHSAGFCASHQVHVAKKGNASEANPNISRMGLRCRGNTERDGGRVFSASEKEILSVSFLQREPYRVLEDDVFGGQKQ